MYWNAPVKINRHEEIAYSHSKGSGQHIHQGALQKFQIRGVSATCTLFLVSFSYSISVVYRSLQSSKPFLDLNLKTCNLHNNLEIRYHPLHSLDMVRNSDFNTCTYNSCCEVPCLAFNSKSKVRLHVALTDRTRPLGVSKFKDELEWSSPILCTPSNSE
jgi:hypothetical protein